MLNWDLEKKKHFLPATASITNILIVKKLSWIWILCLLPVLQQLGIFELMYKQLYIYIFWLLDEIKIRLTVQVFINSRWNPLNKSVEL